MALAVSAPLFSAVGTAQRVAIKSNLLHDATLTPNLGAELAVGRKQTVQLSYGLNPWRFSSGRQWRHWQLIPEYRWWPCSRFNGHFFGIHGTVGEFNMAKVDFTMPFTGWPGDLDSKRYEGWNAGGGITYGYSYILGRHWNIEAAIGVGYEYISYKKYPCKDCGTLEARGHKNYFGPTKLSLSLVYVF